MYDWDARLDHWNAKKGSTDAELASALKLDPSAVSHYRGKRNNPSMETIAKMAVFYETDVSTLLAPLPKSRKAG